MAAAGAFEKKGAKATSTEAGIALGTVGPPEDETLPLSKPGIKILRIIAQIERILRSAERETKSDGPRALEPDTRVGVFSCPMRV